MNLGRRQFLKFLGSAVAGSCVDEVSGIFRSSKYFIDQKLGFGFEIPYGWHLEAFRKDFNKLLGGQQLADPFRDDQELLEELAEGLLATLSKYPLEGDPLKMFSPSVTFFREEDDALIDYVDLRDLAESAISGFSTVLTDYECTHDPEYLKRDDCVAVRSKSKFLFEHKEMDSVLIDNETFLIHHGNSIYTIHLYDSPHSGDASQSEFEIFRSSLHIA